MTTALFMLAIIVMGQNRVDAASWELRTYLLRQRKLAEHGTISMKAKSRSLKSQRIHLIKSNCIKC